MADTGSTPALSPVSSKITSCVVAWIKREWHAQPRSGANPVLVALPAGGGAMDGVRHRCGVNSVLAPIGRWQRSATRDRLCRPACTEPPPPPVTATDPLLQPFRLQGLTLRNRVLSTAHASGYAEGGRPALRYQRYHEEKPPTVRVIVAGGVDGLGQIDDDGAFFAQQHVELRQVAVHHASTQHAHHLQQQLGAMRARLLGREHHVIDAGAASPSVSVTRSISTTPS